MKIKDIMTSEVHVISPDSNIRECATKMRDQGLGALPVCSNDRIVGMITDRDIVTKALTSDKDVNQFKVSELMTSPIVFCLEDSDCEDAARLMEVKQIRRLIVLNHQKRLCGIVSLGDVAAKVGTELSGEVLQKVSEAPDSSKTKVA